MKSGFIIIEQMEVRHLKKLVLILLVVFLTACELQEEIESIIEEPMIAVEETPIVEEVVIEEHEVSIAIMGSNMPSNSFSVFQVAFEFSFDWYSYPNLERLLDYDVVYFFFDDLQQERLQNQGFTLPELKPYEAVLQRYESTDIVWINFSLNRVREEAISNFIKQHSTITDQPLLLIEPVVIDVNRSTYLLNPNVCKIPHSPSIVNPYVEDVLGFPRPERRLPNDRNSKALILYVAFPDYPASKPISELNNDFYNRFYNRFNDYIRAMSYGQVEHEFYFHDEVIMMPKNVESYYLTFQAARTAPRLPVGVDYVSLFVRELLAIADPTVDFTGYDYVIIKTDPSIPTSKANFDWLTIVDEARSYPTEEQTFYNLVFLTNETLRENGDWLALHEVIHLYGLVDYYSRINGVWGGDEFVGSFDLMSRVSGRNNELLLWSRWFIGWVQDDEIDCIDGREPITESLHQIQNTMGNGDTKGIVIRLSEYQVLLIERKERSVYCQSCDEGLIVTRYNSSIPSAHGLLRIIRPEGSIDPDFEDAFLTKGTVLETDGLRIEVLEQTETDSLVSISSIFNS